MRDTVYCTTKTTVSCLLTKFMKAPAESTPATNGAQEMTYSGLTNYTPTVFI